MENYKNSKIGQETAQKYGDIIEMERPQTEESLRKHPRMTLQNRAKIFSPFAVYRKVLVQPVSAALLKLMEAAVGEDPAKLCESWGALCSTLAQTGRLDSLPAAVAEEVLRDDNAFSAALSAGEAAAPLLEAAALRDLRVLYRAAQVTAEELASIWEEPAIAFLPRWGSAPAPAPMERPWGGSPETLAAYHKAHGCGRFVSHIAFLWRDSALLPVEHPDPIRLSQLKSYEYQRQIAVDNTLAFLNGFEANNMLLYGDRGTGKSSTVKAVVNEYAERGLKIIEMSPRHITNFPKLFEQTLRSPFRFIVFLDDLTFSSEDDNFAALKAILEGSVGGRAKNIAVYATSNRRHLIKETLTDRTGDDIHEADTRQELMSLSARFGLTVTFQRPEKARFETILAELAKQHGIDMPMDQLLVKAEAFAIRAGGRSPRVAKQFIEQCEAGVQK